MNQPENQENQGEELDIDEQNTLTVPRLWLDGIVNILRSRTGAGRSLVKGRYAEPYFGRRAQMYGFSYCFEYRHQHSQYLPRFLMISRTHVASTEDLAREKKPLREQLIYELENQVQKIPVEYFGSYHNELDIPGHYATAYCLGEQGKFFFMVSESGRMEPYYKFRASFPNFGV
jgi:hypothetical protein